MRKNYLKYQSKDPNIQYRGATPTRLDNLTDAVFGIAVTLLIFNISDASSFDELILFAKSFPALLIEIIFLALVWKEHVAFSRIYSTENFSVRILNIFFIALVIFYVYPLKFLSNLITAFFFEKTGSAFIAADEIPKLMIFYGLVIFSIYVVIFLFYCSVLKQKGKYDLSGYELLYTKFQAKKFLIMFLVPLISVILIFIFYSRTYAAFLGGISYGLYGILIPIWMKRFKRKKHNFKSTTHEFNNLNQ